PAYFGDYFRFQVSRQVYPTLMHLDAALRGERVDFYSQLRDPEEARAFTIAQHSGSLGPAHVLPKLIDLSGARRLLDVAGGSGAFSIVLCERTPGLMCTIIDFPSVAAGGPDRVGERGRGGARPCRGGGARAVRGRMAKGVVLFRFLPPGGGERPPGALPPRPYKALRPGGRVRVQDFMGEDERGGPPLAALWLLN